MQKLQNYTTNLSFLFPHLQVNWLIACIILSIVFKIGYQEKYSYIHVLFYFIFLLYNTVHAGNNLVPLIDQLNKFKK